MAKDVVMLEYMFMFDPNQTWVRLSEFESMFADYLKTIGFEAEFVETLNLSGKRILYIYKKDNNVRSEIPAGS